VDATAVVGVLAVLVVSLLLGTLLWDVAGVMGALAIVLTVAVAGVISRLTSRRRRD
jgi:hypothetical protein